MHKEAQAYEPYKYVVQDMTNVFIGARFTYGELLDNDETPFKLRAVISHYMLKEASADLSVADHIFRMKEQELSFLAYKQMKARFKVNQWMERGEKTPDGKTVRKSGYVSRLYRIDEIVGNTQLRAKLAPNAVEEWGFKKFALMSVSL